MENYLRPGARVRHETPHLARPQAPTPKEEQSPTIPTTSTNRNPNKRECQSDPIAKRGCKIFFQHIVYYSSLTLDQTNTKIRQGDSSERLQTIPRSPKWSRCSKSRKIRYPRPNYSPRPQLNYCLSLVWYTQFFVRPEIKENKNLPFLQRHFSPSTIPLPSTPKTDQKNARSRIRKRQDQSR